MMTEESGPIIRIKSDVRITSTQDFIDIIFGQRAGVYLLDAECFPTEFFDLSSGVLGEMLQKASTYRKKVGILGDFGNTTSRSLLAFIRESNREGHVVFTSTPEKALELLGEPSSG